MFGIGLPELVIILVVALLVLGPSKLPDAARSLGRALGEFRRMADDVKETFESEMSLEEEKKKESKELEEEQKSAEGVQVAESGELPVQEELKEQGKKEGHPREEGKEGRAEGTNPDEQKRT
jgi:Tat protein translocase TatB subunit